MFTIQFYYHFDKLACQNDNKTCPLGAGEYNLQRYKIFIMGVIKNLSLIVMGYRQHLGKNPR